MLLPMTSTILCAALLLPRLPPHARRAEAPRATEVPPPQPAEPPTEALADLRGALLNEEEKVTVTYSGSAASRERRVRRTRRPNKEERWQRSPEPAGYRRMSAFCTCDAIDLEEAITALTAFSSFGERLSITSYTDVVHCRFLAAPEDEKKVVRDAFLFPCARPRRLLPTRRRPGWPSLPRLDMSSAPAAQTAR